MDNLAVAYTAAGRPDRAIPLHESTLTGLRARLGDDHPATLVAMNNLARTYRAGGRLDEAIRLLETTSARLRAELGDDHPTTLTVMSDLAGAYQDAGSLDRAIPLSRAVLARRRTKLGDDHPDTLFSTFHLAKRLLDARRPEEAIPLMAREFLDRAGRSRTASPPGSAKPSPWPPGSSRTRTESPTGLTATTTASNRSGRAGNPNGRASRTGKAPTPGPRRPRPRTRKKMQIPARPPRVVSPDRPALRNYSHQRRHRIVTRSDGLLGRREEGMLVLSRKPSQQIRVGPDIVITIVKIDRNHVRVGIEAPPDIPILRQELADSRPMPAQRPATLGARKKVGH